MLAVTGSMRIRKTSQANDNLAKLPWPRNTVSNGFEDPRNGCVVMYASVVRAHVHKLPGLPDENLVVEVVSCFCSLAMPVEICRICHAVERNCQYSETATEDIKSLLRQEDIELKCYLMIICCHGERGIWTLAGREIDDSITLLAPPWGSAVEGGVNHGGPRFAQKSRSHLKLSIKTLGARGLARRSQAVESTTVSHFWLPHGGLQLRVG